MAKKEDTFELLDIKKGIPLYPNLVNLKSNTMKNTMQSYGFKTKKQTKCQFFLFKPPYLTKMKLFCQLKITSRNVFPASCVCSECLEQSQFGHGFVFTFSWPNWDCSKLLF